MYSSETACGVRIRPWLIQRLVAEEGLFEMCKADRKQLVTIGANAAAPSRLIQSLKGPCQLRAVREAKGIPESFNSYIRGDA